MIAFYEQHGYAIIPGFFSEDETDILINELVAGGAFDYDNLRDVSAEALFRIDAVAREALSGKFKQLANAALGELSLPHQALILDKTKAMNWGLDWHQDLNITVKQSMKAPGYTGWSDEGGVLQVIPPLPVLQHMITVRLHLDDCDGHNGAMWVIPGSHRDGIFAKNDIPEIVNTGMITECPVRKGGVMLMSPLLLHKSPYSLSDKNRRLLQVEYRSCGLSGGVDWKYIPSL